MIHVPDGRGRRVREGGPVTLRQNAPIFGWASTGTETAKETAVPPAPRWTALFGRWSGLEAAPAGRSCNAKVRMCRLLKIIGEIENIGGGSIKFHREVLDFGAVVSWFVVDVE